MRPLAIALTGGIAMGKSTAAEVFQRQGDLVLDADVLVRQAYTLPQVQTAITNRVEGVLDAQGKVDFASLRAAISVDTRLLDWLESLLQPLVTDSYVQALENYRGECIVGVVPLLFETGLERLFHKVIALSLKKSTQKSRVLARPGMDDDWFSLISARQLSNRQRNQRADLVLPGDLPLDVLEKRLLESRKTWLQQC